jgi:hypothetical protein
MVKHIVCLSCVLVLLNFVTLAQEPNWNQWRGSNSVNHSLSTGIAKSWSAEGPKLLWKIDTIGTGYSCFSFFGDMMFTMGDVDNQCWAFALDRKTGKEIWRSSTPVGKAGSGLGEGRQSSGPLSTPACDGENVYVFGQYGDFVAYSMKEGKEQWRTNIVNDLGGGKMSMWGFAQSPILDGDKILLPIGGDGGTLGAFDKSGKLLWRSTEIHDQTGYTSVVPAEIGGVRQYMLLTGESLVGISPADGKILWGATFPGKTAVCSDPVLCGDVIMASCSYGVGAYFYRIAKEGNTFKASEFKAALTELQSHHGGIIAVGNHFYLMTNANNLACVEAKTGNVIWTNRGVGKGSMHYVDGKLILRSESGDGTIAMVEATPAGYKELGRFDQPDRSDKNSWTYPVVVDKRLYIRDQNLLLCYDLN